MQLSGRDATVRGRVPTVEMHRLVVDNVAAVHGVRIVKDKVAVVPGSEALAPMFLSLPLTVTLHEGRITFAGTVATGAVRDILIDRASAAVGGDSVSSVVDRLTVRAQTNNVELASYRCRPSDNGCLDNHCPVNRCSDDRCSDNCCSNNRYSVTEDPNDYYVRCRPDYRRHDCATRGVRSRYSASAEQNRRHPRCLPNRLRPR